MLNSMLKDHQHWQNHWKLLIICSWHFICSGYYRSKILLNILEPCSLNTNIFLMQKLEHTDNMISGLITVARYIKLPTSFLYCIYKFIRRLLRNVILVDLNTDRVRWDHVNIIQILLSIIPLMNINGTIIQILDLSPKKIICHTNL